MGRRAVRCGGFGSFLPSPGSWGPVGPPGSRDRTLVVYSYQVYSEQGADNVIESAQRQPVDTSDEGGSPAHSD
jgi:hypothetical protein